MTGIESSFQPGVQLGSIVLDHGVTEGRFGVVHRGYDHCGRPVAVKVGRGHDRSAGIRVIREAELLGSLSHPNLVPFVAAGTSGDEPYLVTTWVEGRSLADVMAGYGPLNIEAALAVARQLADVLDYLHDQNVLYRDLSLSNVIVDERRRATLIDLGSAHRIDEAAPALPAVTEDQTIAATAAYVAPEVIRGTPVAGPRSDQYSLAAVLYELVAGQPPFPPQANAASTLYQHLDAAPTPLIEVRPAVPRALDAAIARGLAKDPADRFDSLRAFVEAASANRDPADKQPAAATRSKGRVLWPGAAAVVVGLGLLVWRGVGFGDDDNAASTSPDPQPVEASEVGVSEDGTLNDESGAQPPLLLWTAGSAAGLECNLLAEPGFDSNSTGLDFYGEPPDSERVLDQGGLGESGALEVGRDDRFGLYGEAVPIEVGMTYRFAGWFGTSGNVVDTKIGVTFADADYETVATTELPLDPGLLQFTAIETVAAPVGSVYALPWIFKDASPGSVYADELVFAATPGCADDLITTAIEPGGLGG